VPLTWNVDGYGNTIYPETEVVKGIDLECTYEEQVEAPANNPRW
jgi:hypothetical protein